MSSNRTYRFGAAHRSPRSICGLGFYVLGLAAMLALPLGAHAQPADIHAATRDQSGGGTRLVILGSGGGPIARTKRGGPAAMLQIDDHVYLIDAGEGVLGRLAAAGQGAADVEHIFLSHLHLDHVAGLSTLLGVRWTYRPASDVTVHGPAGTAQLVGGLEQYLAIPEALFTAQTPPGMSLAEMIKVREFDAPSAPAEIYRDDNLVVSAVANTHYATMPQSPELTGKGTVALRFDTADRSIVFTGDTGPSEAVERLASGADILVSEVVDLAAILAYFEREFDLPRDRMQSAVDFQSHAHLTPEEVGKMAARAGVKMVVLTHFVPGLDSEMDMRGYSEGVREYFDGPVVAAADLMEF